MSLEETKKELEEQLAKAIEREDKEAAEELDAPVETVEEEKPAEELKVEEPVVETKPEEPKTVEEVKKTPAEYAKERRDRADLQRQVNELREQLAEVNKPKAAVDAEPDPTDELEHTKWQLRQTNSTVSEFADWKKEQEHKQFIERNRKSEDAVIVALEQKTRQEIPEYDDIKQHYVGTLATALRLANPALSGQSLSDAVDRVVRNQLNDYAANGYENPIKELVKSKNPRQSQKNLSQI
jgi:hypothetical protein